MRSAAGRWSRTAFAGTVATFGIVGLIKTDFTPMWLPGPDIVPAHAVLARVAASVALLAGAGLLWRHSAAVASRVLLGFFLAWLLLVVVPALVGDFGMQFTWATACAATLLAAAGIVYLPFAGGHGRTYVRIARTLYGAALIPFGIAHFTYLQRTVSMVPRWLPWPTAWAYFFGATFVAAGIAVIVGVYARLAAVLTAVQLALFTALVWIPVIAAAPTASDWSEFITSWVLTVAAWVIADSYRGVPWLGMRSASLPPSAEEIL